MILALRFNYSEANRVKSSTDLIVNKQNKLSADILSSNVKVKTSFHHHGVEKLDRTDFLDRLIALLEDPRVDLVVGLLAGGFAFFEIIKDFQSLGAHHGLKNHIYIFLEIHFFNNTFRYVKVLSLFLSSIH